MPRVTYWCDGVQCQAPAAKKTAAANGGKKAPKRAAAKARSSESA